MPKQYFILRSQLAILRRAAKRAGIREVCFVVFGSGSMIKRLVPVANRASDKVMRHVFWAEDVERVRARRIAKNLKILGLLHTHIISDAVPGEGDIRGYAVGALMFIFCDLEDKLRAFRMTGRGKGYSERAVLIVDCDKKRTVNSTRPTTKRCRARPTRSRNGHRLA